MYQIAMRYWTDCSLFNLHASVGFQSVIVSAYNLKTNEELSDLTQSHSYPHSHGLPKEVCVIK